jgi:chromosome segregation ATPase
VKELGDRIDDYEAAALKVLEEQKHLDSIASSCVKDGEDLIQLMEAIEEDLSDPIFAQSPDAVQKEKDRLDGSLDPKFEQLGEIESRFTTAFNELSSSGRDVNLPELTGEALLEKLQKLKENREEHTEKLESMLDDAVQNDALCQEFAEQAKAFREDCARQTEEANTTEGTLGPKNNVPDI